MAYGGGYTHDFAGIAELLGKHFTSADVRHFPFPDEVRALGWLETA